ncbi:MotA/TolQ/ExbB proton channel family protein [Waterburya agarophytonicola K14]|uniref:MotA/TolQ/ExbB proton channel family protein n=1 Tax=Waterburya agarophytonicola KI4 TaxID=2874699 RepID=A0A964FHH0_9CYAN|nr:MotA/TolQ/ExbB proton channel family protein [Waterburya agarophytonicola]MCC0177493.1 MotA/TolQ/ExbB proton channel family protein [Waterburya agarophytonicola KI4]
MSKFRPNKPKKPRSRNSKRQELEVDSRLLFAIAAAIFLLIYLIVGIIPGLRQSYIGKLLYDQGQAQFVQFIVVALTAIVVAFTGLKIFLLRTEYEALGKIWIADHIPLDRPDAHEVAYFQERLIKDGNLVALRCGRILKAYIQSGDRATANEFALDDSSFYLSASESSYAVPRILVWAIPLLGFVGTVIGISGAVSGFSGVLESSGDVEAIKGGIGNVTTSLGLAFDTTLLALFLSVLVMIPLVLVERYESKLLLGIDVFVNDKLLPRLRKKSGQVDPATIDRAIEGAIKEHFPNPRDLVEPAHSYAQQAAKSLSTGFIAEISKVQDVSSQVIAQVNDIKQQTNRDRQEFLNFFAQQQQANQELVQQIRSVIEEIRSKNMEAANDLNAQTQGIGQQLENAARVLENKVGSLEIATQKMSDFQHIQQGLERSFTSLEKTAQLENVLSAVKDNLAQLQPILQQLNKPRRITIVEQDNHQNS